jgi:hypothetical protein
MTIRTALGALLLFLSAPAGAAERPKACTAPEHRQFDFWIGEWTVTLPDGKHAGDNRIESILEGCALAESWRGASGGAGHSYNAYDRERKVWHQTWVDRDGEVLLLDGGLRDGRMVLGGMRGGRQQRITWTPQPDGTVRQLWESSGDQGKAWRVEFDGRYTRKR